MYGSPENTGDSMEVTRIKDMFDTGSKDDKDAAWPSLAAKQTSVRYTLTQSSLTL